MGWPSLCTNAFPEISVTFWCERSEPGLAKRQANGEAASLIPLPPWKGVISGGRRDTRLGFIFREKREIYVPPELCTFEQMR